MGFHQRLVLFCSVHRKIVELKVKNQANNVTGFFFSFIFTRREINYEKLVTKEVDMLVQMDLKQVSSHSEAFKFILY